MAQIMLSDINSIKITEAMFSTEKFPVISSTTLIKETIESMTKFNIGVACIVEDSNLLGVFTDGDLRRLLLSHQKPFPAIFADDVSTYMTKSPCVIKKDASILDAITLINEKKIWDLPVLDSNKLVGLVNLHTLVTYINSQ